MLEDGVAIVIDIFLISVSAIDHNGNFQMVLSSLISGLCPDSTLFV